MTERLLGNRYLIKRRLGKGGCGSVYLCHDNKLHKDWAVKELEQPTDLERSMELELLKTISCNAFPRIVDIVKENGSVFLVMDYIEGITLKEKAQRQVLTERDVLPWALEIAKGIQYLHQMSVPILFMDCKPDNILLTKEGEIRLVDLGSAYVCFRDKKQYISGTKYFAPKEQREKKARSGGPDVRTDIYAFGMTLYYLLTGGGAECRNKGKLCIRSINPSVSWGMSYIIEKCTMENPDMRYQSMDEVIEQIIHIKKLNRWKQGKVYMYSLWASILKTACVIASLVSAYVYQINGQLRFLILSIICLLILFYSCSYKKITMYEIKHDVFCGSGKRILYFVLLGIGFISTLHITSYAAKNLDSENRHYAAKDLDSENRHYAAKDLDSENRHYAAKDLDSENRHYVVKEQYSENGQCMESVSKDLRLNVVLYDGMGRKILIKDGAKWKIEEDMMVKIPIAELEGGSGEITISYTNEGSGICKRYLFGCYIE